MEELEQYIKNMKSEGVSEAKIKSKLKSVGWKEEQYENYFQSNKQNDIEKLKGEGPYKLSPKMPIASTLNFGLASILSLPLIYFFYYIAIINFEFLPSMVQVISYTPVVILVLCIIEYIHSKFFYKYFKFYLKEKHFQKECGILYKRFVTIPYDRIQNIDIYQSLIDRFFNLYRISIQTAGNSGHSLPEGKIPFIDKEQAWAVRKALLENIEKSKSNQRSL